MIRYHEKEISFRHFNIFLPLPGIHISSRKMVWNYCRVENFQEGWD